MSEPSFDTRRVLRLVFVLLFLLACTLSYVLGGMPMLLLLLAASALALTIFLFWSSLQKVDDSEDMDFVEALSLAAPSATEEQKRALLRTLKDLEYELSVGKISREDFDKVSEEYRAEAKRVIFQADEEMRARIARAEELVAKRLRREAQKAALRSPSPAKSARAQSDHATTEQRPSTKQPVEVTAGDRDSQQNRPNADTAGIDDAAFVPGENSK